MAARFWTPEQRLQQSQAIANWRPWESATGPRSAEGKAMSARNAYRGGERSTLRAEAKHLNAALRKQGKFLDDVRGKGGTS